MPDYRKLMQMIAGDDPDDDDTQGVKPTASPVDFIAAGIPGAARGLAASIPRIAGASTTDALMAQAAKPSLVEMAGKSAASAGIQQAAKQQAMSKMLSPDIESYQDSGMMSPDKWKQLQSLGQKVPQDREFNTVADYVRAQPGGSKLPISTFEQQQMAQKAANPAIDLNAFRQAQAPTQILDNPSGVDSATDAASDAVKQQDAYTKLRQMMKKAK